jgi:hypothetical protein
MIRFFFVMTMLCLTLAGCGDVEWFPDPGVIPGDGTVALDVTPFSFTAKTGVTAGQVQTSDPVVISMTGGPAKISVDGGGRYKIDSGEFTIFDGTVSNGQQVTLEHTHAAGAVAQVTTVTIGEESGTFTSTTASAVIDIPVFSFPAKTGTAGTLTTSDSIPISLGSATSAPIRVADGEYRIGTGEFTSLPGTVNAGQTVTVRHTSAAGQTVSTLTIGSRSATFVSNTPVVAAFSFNPSQVSVPINTLQTSSSVTLSITGGSAPISVATTSDVSNGLSEYSINGGAFTSSPGEVENGKQVRVRHRSFTVAGHSVTTQLTVGDKKATFTSRTIE